jgi:hypothetical protein
MRIQEHQLSEKRRVVTLGHPFHVVFNTRRDAAWLRRFPGGLEAIAELVARFDRLRLGSEVRVVILVHGLSFSLSQLIAVALQLTFRSDRCAREPVGDPRWQPCHSSDAFATMKGLLASRGDVSVETTRTPRHGTRSTQRFIVIMGMAAGAQAERACVPGPVFFRVAARTPRLHLSQSLFQSW